MPERVSVPGFREGRRYRSIGNAPRYLMMYLTESADVLSSDGYMSGSMIPRPGPGSRSAISRRPSRNVYTLLSTCGDTSVAGVSVSGLHPVRHRRRRRGTGYGHRSGTSSCPVGAALPQAGRAQFYGIDTVVSGIETAERGIYEGAGLAAISASRRMRAVRSDRFRGLAGVVDRPGREHDRRQPPITHVIRETFRIDYMLPAA